MQNCFELSSFPQGPFHGAMHDLVIIINEYLESRGVALHPWPTDRGNKITFPPTLECCTFDPIAHFLDEYNIGDVVPLYMNPNLRVESFLRYSSVFGRVCATSRSITPILRVISKSHLSRR